jgi:hypothetical protein
MDGSEVACEVRCGGQHVTVTVLSLSRIRACRLLLLLLAVSFDLHNKV